MNFEVPRELERPQIHDDCQINRRPMLARLRKHNIHLISSRT